MSYEGGHGWKKQISKKINIRKQKQKTKNKKQKTIQFMNCDNEWMTPFSTAELKKKHLTI